MTRSANRIKIAAIVIVAVILTSCAEAKPGPSPLIGRYQIVQGEYLHYGSSGRLTSSGVFKLDTVTGETYQYFPGIMGLAVGSSWKKVE